MGFKNIVLSRIDYKEKEIRKKNQTMEFVWKPFSQIENVNTEIFTHIQYDGYCMPGDLGFLIEDKDLNKTDSEIAVISKKFYETMKNISKTYNHSQVLLTYGCDFSYRNRTFNFKNIVESGKSVMLKFLPNVWIYEDKSKYIKGEEKRFITYLLQFSWFRTNNDCRNQHRFFLLS